MTCLSIKFVVDGYTTCCGVDVALLRGGNTWWLAEGLKLAVFELVDPKSTN